MKWIVLLLLASTCCQAQNAKVVELTPAEASEAKYLQEQREKIADRIERFNKQLTAKYLVAKEGESYSSVSGSNGDYIRIKSGWQGTFIFSEDYRFIVPGPQPTYSPSSLSMFGGCINPASASGTTAVAW